MKIICMDCHTESCIEIELLKDKKHLVCEHCAKNLQASSTNQEREQIYFPVVDAFDLHSATASEPLSESGVSKFGEDDVLEIPLLPEIAQFPKIDEIILTPTYDSNRPSLEEAINAVSIDDNTVEAEALATESPRQNFSTVIPVAEASAQISDSSNSYCPVAESVSEIQMPPKPVKLLTVKTSILMAASVAFVLFIAFGDKIIRSAGKPSPQAENSSPIIAPKQDIQMAHSAASSARPETAVATQPEMPKPAPTLAAQVSETKATDAGASAGQPPAIMATEGQFTIQVGSHNNVGQANEQAEKLKAAGFEPRIVSVDIPKRGRWYRVQSGSFHNRAEANRYGSQILAKGAAGTFVVSAL